MTSVMRMEKSKKSWFRWQRAEEARGKQDVPNLDHMLV